MGTYERFGAPIKEIVGQTIISVGLDEWSGLTTLVIGDIKEFAVILGQLFFRKHKVYPIAH